jgi:hypothetical protein
MEAVKGTDEYGKSASSPRHQMISVTALEKMPETADRGLFVKYAVHTDSEEVALFNQQIAQMHAGVSRNVDKIENFVQLADLVASRSAKGKLIVAAPLDYVIWNEYTARILEAFDDYAKETPAIKGTELWLTGSLSPMTRGKLKEKGWELYEQCEKRLWKTSP